MLRPALSALVLGLLAAPPALAAAPGEGVEMRLEIAAGLGLVADISRTSEEAAAGRLLRDVSMAGVAWRQDGWKLAATAGLFGYDYAGAGQGVARAASFAVGHELATALGGSLAFEVRHSVLWEADSRLDITSARVGWSVRF
jgi:hypothetical protein